jgi:5'-3' exonuclease
MEKLLIIDAQNICHIAKHSCHGLTFGELDTGVIFGFLRQMKGFAKVHGTSDLAFAWDSPISKRKEMFKGYKADREVKRREKTEVEKRFDAVASQQFNTLREYILPKLGFRNSFMEDGYEADDIMASIVMDKRNQGIKIIVSSDDDLLQLLNYCMIWLPGKKCLITKNSFSAIWEISPEQWVTVICLTGGHNNLNGIPDVGPQTAVKYIRGILKPGKLMDRIEGSSRLVKTNLPLVKLPLRGTPTPDIKTYYHSKKRFISVFEEFGLKSFLKAEEFSEWVRIFQLE